MTPRKYESDRRAAAAADTRRRILEASLALHRAKGFRATSFADIAERADVAIGTVYYHFPTLDDLVPACAGLAAERTHAPEPAIFDGVRGRAARVATLVRAVCGWWDRNSGYENVLRERHALPAVDRVAREVEVTAAALRETALGTLRADIAGSVDALLDYRVWASFRARGIRREVIERTLVAAITALLRTEKSPRPS